MNASRPFIEHQIILEYGIAGILTLPEQVTLIPAALLLHGFGNHKNEVGNLYQRLAATLAGVQVASLRIDFRGWGESAGHMADTTIAQQVEDAQTAYHYLTSLDTVDSARIGIVGFSLGGATAMITASQNPEHFQSMVIWSSALPDLKSDFTDGLGEENVDRAMQEGIVTIDLGWRSVTLKDTFFQSLANQDLLNRIQAYTGDLLMIAGSADNSADVMDEYLGNARGAKKEAFLVEGADHIYNVLEEDQTYAERVIHKTAHWLSSNL